jgi:hypothetical protein
MPGLGVATFPAVAETRGRWVLISWDGEAHPACKDWNMDRVKKIELE